jgi:subtilisin-like proprotein convertase family protein
MVLIEHPKMKELLISLIGTDGSSTYTIWNRKDSSESQTRITGSTTTFNNIDPNDNWMLAINNNGTENGRLIEWFLKIYYEQK